ncbi:hypothetical protein CLF_110040 [Clonorchis sinensis]|uniref:Uncharacterized protein n=1 Tax=Clonorchis sinensis TaxID=79923 RepID=G7YT51_CLOSI|nr:hypothetical protein CLF_110040 [Clonorchis sinensis]
MEGTIEKSGSEVSRKICIPLNPKHDLRQIFHWYGEHIRHENDSLLFVSIIKPQFTMPVLVGTAIEIPWTNVKRAKELCREAMQLAKKHGLKANSYIYVGTNQQKTLTQCLRELQPDLVLVKKQMKNMVMRKFTGDSQTMLNGVEENSYERILTFWLSEARSLRHYEIKRFETYDDGHPASTVAVGWIQHVSNRVVFQECLREAQHKRSCGFGFIRPHFLRFLRTEPQTIGSNMLKGTSFTPSRSNPNRRNASIQKCSDRDNNLLMMNQDEIEQNFELCSQLSETDSCLVEFFVYQEGRGTSSEEVDDIDVEALHDQHWSKTFMAKLVHQTEAHGRKYPYTKELLSYVDKLVPVMRRLCRFRLSEFAMVPLNLDYVSHAKRFVYRRLRLKKALTGKYRNYVQGFLSDSVLSENSALSCVLHRLSGHLIKATIFAVIQLHVRGGASSDNDKRWPPSIPTNAFVDYQAEAFMELLKFLRFRFPRRFKPCPFLVNWQFFYSKRVFYSRSSSTFVENI